jgi:hypothetical protein
MNRFFVQQRIQYTITTKRLSSGQEIYLKYFFVARIFPGAYRCSGILPVLILHCFFAETGSADFHRSAYERKTAPSDALLARAQYRAS